MGLPQDRDPDSSISISTQVEGAVAAEREKQILRLRESLSAIFESLEEYYTAEANGDETQQIAERIDQMLSELILSFDNVEFSALTEEERDHIDSLRAENRQINEIGSYVETLVDLYSSVGTRRDVLGLIDLQSNDRFALQRAFLVQFLVAIEEFRDEQSAENLIRINSLVKAYERMQIQTSIAQASVVKHCRAFTEFFNSNIMSCLRPNQEVQMRNLDTIYEEAGSLLRSLKPVVKA